MASVITVAALLLGSGSLAAELPPGIGTRDRRLAVDVRLPPWNAIANRGSLRVWSSDVAAVATEAAFFPRRVGAAPVKMMAQPAHAANREEPST